MFCFLKKIILIKSFICFVFEKLSFFNCGFKSDLHIFCIRNNGEINRME